MRFLPALLPVALACACSSSTSNDSSGPDKAGAVASLNAAADAALDSASSDAPNADDLRANQILLSELSADEQVALQKIDFAKLDDAAILHNPLLLKAMEAVEAAGGADPAAKASSLGFRHLSLQTTYQCKYDCAECQSALREAVGTVIQKLARKTIGGALVCTLVRRRALAARSVGPWSSVS